MLGLALGIDYALLTVSRFREARSRRLERRRRAAEAAARHAGSTVALSGAAVAIGFLGLLLVPLQELRSAAVGGLLVVTFSVLVATTLLPATLAALGARGSTGAASVPARHCGPTTTVGGDGAFGSARTPGWSCSSPESPWSCWPSRPRVSIHACPRAIGSRRRWSRRKPGPTCARWVAGESCSRCGSCSSCPRRRSRCRPGRVDAAERLADALARDPRVARVQWVAGLVQRHRRPSGRRGALAVLGEALVSRRRRRRCCCSRSCPAKESPGPKPPASCASCGDGTRRR